MRLRDEFTAKAIAAVHETAASNSIPYLGEGLFPAEKKTGLDLKWIRTSTGLPVTLKASSFDTVSTIRSREGFKISETEMAYFKESMLVKEVDEQEIMRVQESSDPYAKEVLARIFNDAETLVSGAEVVPERMRMQLLSSTSGNPSISISADGATYAYNYDPDNEYKTHNYVQLTLTDMWSDTTHSDPMGDIQTGMDAVANLTGDVIKYVLVSKNTFNYIKNNANVRSAILAQNVSANVFLTDARVQELFRSELGITILVYSKQYINESGQTVKFYPDGVATLLPEGALGKTWFGTTPDERTLLGDPTYDCEIVGTGIAVTVTSTSDPVHTKTTVSEIVLPSFERMSSTYTIDAYR